jgi:hypothetical protein
VSLVVQFESNSTIFSRTRQDQGQITLFAPPKPLRKPQEAQEEVDALRERRD